MYSGLTWEKAKTLYEFLSYSWKLFTHNLHIPSHLSAFYLVYWSERLILFVRRRQPFVRSSYCWLLSNFYCIDFFLSFWEKCQSEEELEAQDSRGENLFAFWTWHRNTD